jgi:hypothetical protein
LAHKRAIRFLAKGFFMTESLSMARDARKPAAAQRSADLFFKAWESRTQLVKKELAAASAANDAKTTRLRALRLEKERQDAEEAAALTATASPNPKMKKKRARHVGG